MTHKNAIKLSEVLEKIEAGNIGIYDIEAITEDCMDAIGRYHMTLKDHDIYFVDFKGYFGFSVLVFKRGMHIKYANDYELHHKGKSHEELVKLYINKLKNKLFTESELLEEDVKSYDDFQKKGDYIRNLYPLQWDHESMFFIGSDEERKERQRYIEKNYPYFSNVCFSYFDDIWVPEKIKQLYDHVSESFNKLQKNDDVFAEMVRKELFNHECGYTYDPSEALATMGLNYNKLSDARKAIVKHELDYVIEHTA